MTYHRYITIIACIGLIAWLAWVMVIFRLNPFELMGVSLSLFFLTLFLSLAATFTVIGFYFRVWFFNNEIFYRQINTAIRQGVLLSLLANISLLFQVMRVLTWWSAGILLVIMVLLEYYFSSIESELL